MYNQAIIIMNKTSHFCAYWDVNLSNLKQARHLLQAK